MLAIILSMVSASSLTAQWAIGPHLIISAPQGDFSDVYKSGEGLGIKFMYEMPVVTFVTLRADVNYISYGARPGSYGYWITSDRNEAFRLIAGPQFSFGVGSFKFYTIAMGGVYNFRHVQTVSDYYGYYGYADTRESRTKLGWTAGGGILWDIGVGPWVDLEVRYHTITDIIDYEPGDYDGNDLTVNLGVLFFLNK